MLRKLPAAPRRRWEADDPRCTAADRSAYTGLPTVKECHGDQVRGGKSNRACGGR
jgi:hypothetical protein